MLWLCSNSEVVGHCETRNPLAVVLITNSWIWCRVEKAKHRYAVMQFLGTKVKIFPDNSILARSLMHGQTSKINIRCMLDTTCMVRLHTCWRRRRKTCCENSITQKIRGLAGAYDLSAPNFFARILEYNYLSVYPSVRMLYLQ
jgi:hypothetical protein